MKCSIWFWMLCGDIHNDGERALAIISYLAFWEKEMQDEDDRQRAFGLHISHCAVPESTQPLLKNDGTTHHKSQIKEVNNVWCVHLKGQSHSPCVIASM